MNDGPPFRTLGFLPSMDPALRQGGPHVHSLSSRACTERRFVSVIILPSAPLGENLSAWQQRGDLGKAGWLAADDGMTECELEECWPPPRIPCVRIVVPYPYPSLPPFATLHITTFRLPLQEPPFRQQLHSLLLAAQLVNPDAPL